MIDDRWVSSFQEWRYTLASDEKKKNGNQTLLATLQSPSSTPDRHGIYGLPLVPLMGEIFIPCAIPRGIINLVLVVHGKDGMIILPPQT